LHLEQGARRSLERKADCAGDQDINGRRPLSSCRHRDVGGGVVGKNNQRQCQCQAADDDSGDDGGDCRSPDAAWKEAGASLRHAEGQYFPWFIWLLTICGSLKVHGRRRPAF
jgi:hypothetical protein